jgi:hypothetical protein
LVVLPVGVGSAQILGIVFECLSLVPPVGVELPNPLLQVPEGPPVKSEVAGAADLSSDHWIAGRDISSIAANCEIECGCRLRACMMDRRWTLARASKTPSSSVSSLVLIVNLFVNY